MINLFEVETIDTVANVRWDSRHWRSVSRPDLIWSTALPRPLAAMFGWMARVPTPTWPLALQDYDEEPDGAGYVEDEGASRPPRDTFGTRPGVPSAPRSLR